MENEKVSKKIESWAKAMEEINKVTKELNKKPALIVYRTNWGEFRGFLNQEAIEAAEKTVEGAKYCWLDICYFEGDLSSFVKLTLSKEYQTCAIKNDVLLTLNEPVSYKLYPYSDISTGQFNIHKIKGMFLFGDYFGPSFRFFFLYGGLPKTSKEQKALYFNG